MLSHHHVECLLALPSVNVTKYLEKVESESGKTKQIVSTWMKNNSAAWYSLICELDYVSVIIVILSPFLIINAIILIIYFDAEQF